MELRSLLTNGQIGLIRGNRLTASSVVREKGPKRQKATDVVEDDPLPPNRWEATPTTALHNVIDYPNKDEFFALSKIIFAIPPTTVIHWSSDDYRRSLTPTDRIEHVPAAVVGSRSLTAPPPAANVGFFL